MLNNSLFILLSEDVMDTSETDEELCPIELKEEIPSASIEVKVKVNR